MGNWMGAVLATAVSVAGVAATPPSGANLLTGETDFEVGADGWYSMGAMKPGPYRTKDGAAGAWSLEVKGDDQIRCGFVWDALQPETTYTVSFYAKGDRGKVQLSVITDNWQWLAAVEKNLEPTWKRQTLTFRTKKKGNLSRAFYLSFRQPNATDEQWMRLDGIKLEKGAQATDYAPAACCLFAALDEPGEIHFAEDGAPVLKVRAVGSAIKTAPTRPVVEVMDAEGRVLAARSLSGEETRVPVEAARAVGYHPCTTRIRDANGNVIATRETPFVVTRRAAGNRFMGVQLNAGVSAEALRRVGFEWVRSNTKFWMWEEKDGPHPLTGREKVATAHPNRFRLLATAWGTQAPPWALGKGRVQWTDDVNKATNYLANLVHTTTNVVDHYEIINEPDLWLPNEKGVTFEQACAYYVEVVRLCADYLHKAGKPVVIDVSGVSDGNRLVDYVLKRIPEAVDIVSAHSYSWPRQLSEDGRTVSDPETGGFLNDVRRKTALLKKYGKTRLVLGELGWSLDLNAPYASASAAQYGWYLARMYLLARTFPEVEYLIWYSLVNSPEGGRFDYGLWRATQTGGVRPTPAVAAACEVARRLPARDSGVRLLEQDGLYLLGWRSGEGVTFAYWTDESMNEPLTAVDNGRARAFDYTGRRLDAARLTLSGAPVYLEFADRSKAKAALPTLRAALQTAYAKRPAPVREEVTVTRLSGCDWKTYDFTKDASVERLGQSRGDVQPPDPGVQWSDPDDLSALTLLKWDDANLYFFARVTDDIHCKPAKDELMYRNDVIQIAVDPKDNAKKNGGYLSDDCEFGLCEGSPLYAWRLPKGEAGYLRGDCVTIARTGNQTEYRAAIPWKAMDLDRAPATLGLAFAICDNDDNALARYWIAWGHGIVDGKRPARFKRIVLKP